MKHSIYITPLNCAFDAGMNSFIKMEEDEYNSSSTRAIYCKDPLQSWFKFKSFTEGTPYLEPSIFGLNVGDIITVEFDGLLVSGDNPLNFGVSFRGINGNTVNNNPLHQCTLPNNSFDTSFKHFKIPFIIMSDMDNTTGILLNIRAFAGNKHEIIIKNLKLTVETDNPNFSLVNNYVDYKSYKDFLKSINYVSGTSVNASLNTVKQIYTDGGIAISDDEIVFNTSNTLGKWKGLASQFTVDKYPNPIAVYIEYKCNDEDTFFGVYSQSFSEKDTKVDAEKFNRNLSMIPKDVYTKKIVYLKSNYVNKRNEIVLIGMSSTEIKASIKRVIFSIPRFDDGRKCNPNDLYELYPLKDYKSL